MVLLIPNAIRKIKAEGRAEERKRIGEVLDRLNASGNGEPVALTPAEIKKILLGNPDSRS